MYVGIDIGGTKTLVAALTNEGVIKESVKFPTPADYDDFVKELDHNVANFATKEFRGGAVAAPGTLDRNRGVVKAFGNLGWKNVPLLRDVEKITHCPMVMENDAKLAALSEAMLLKHEYGKVLYITISTGIGYGLVIDQKIDPNIGDAGGRGILVEWHGKLTPWESFASGSALVRRFGKRASDLEDPKAWGIFAKDLSLGFLELIAILQPEIIVVGGGAGHYLEKFHHELVANLKEHETPMLPIPKIIKAQRPDEAVVYGCYDLAKVHYKEMHA